jgi:hypothetical protein
VRRTTAANARIRFDFPVNHGQPARDPVERDHHKVLQYKEKYALFE